MDLKDTVQKPVPEEPVKPKPVKTPKESIADAVESDAETKRKEEEKQRQEEINDIIREYVLNGNIEKTYTSKVGLTITFCAPTQGQLMQALTATDEEAFAEETHMSIDRMQLIKNNNILAIYTKKYNKKDYGAEQGDKFITQEGFEERKEHLLNASTMNVFAMDWAIKRLNEFQTLVTDAFDERNLKNI